MFENGAVVTSTLQTAAEAADIILATSGPDSAVIPPTGGTLIYSNTAGINATVQFPAGALAVTETVSYVPLDNLPTGGIAFALVPNLTFNQPVTITLYYRDEDFFGMDENSLQLYNDDWPTHSWIAASPCGGYLRDPDANMLQAAVCHFSDYGLIDWSDKLYLPLTLNYSQS